jgi:hypothetical protein
MSYQSEPFYDHDFESWSTAMDAAFEADPSQFDIQTQHVIHTMLSGEPVDDVGLLYDAYESAVKQYRAMFDDMDGEAFYENQYQREWERKYGC